MDRKPNPKWRRLGAEITKARRRAKMTQAQAAKAMAVVPSTVSAWERGTRGLQEEAARELDLLYKTSGVVLRAWNTANTPSALPDWYEEVEQLEALMSELREYQPLVFPGLVQTVRYATAVLRDTTPLAKKTELEDMVESRERRQKILSKDDPPKISVVVEAEVLYRPIGGTDVLREQLGYLLDLIDKGVIRLQVVPPRPSFHHGGAGPFRIYGFPDKPTLVSAEHMGGEQLMDEMNKVQHCAAVFGLLQSEALSTRESRDLIRKVKEELDDNET
ncbi:helix-turn-helix transcriptional regulator [Nocardiopsis sp. NRRL B-16309]|uniref:helix-turn-helix domain-containing protein n=1 Tax=Nocardiopsis sp. NRRL B-16309 TaxID=1519494 RepID=UPI0006AE222B|nr:helix-turn-helix transcriptional regulator [Nocardiopsis sp. NRRL B-16309]KOX20829.1 XRE family transcriptional regulator [Nocardiopsis sp. NRRL B-16309]